MWTPPYCEKQDSKELSPRLLERLLKWQHKILLRLKICTSQMVFKYVWTCLDSIQYKFLRFIWFLNMSRLVQNQYCYNLYDSQTCLNLIGFNMILIVTIHMILKHVYTCSELILLQFLWFSNMFKLVQDQYDMNWYNS